MNEPAARGRPTTYTRAIADEVCKRLEREYSLIRVCRDPKMPAESSVRGWVMADEDGFAARYARARMVGYQAMADEIVHISDDQSGDVIVDEDGKPRVDHENIQRARLMVDTRKWLLSKVLPKIYGDKVALTDGDGKPFMIQVVRFDLPAPELKDVMPAPMVLEHAAAHAPQAPNTVQPVDNAKDDKP